MQKIPVLDSEKKVMKKKSGNVVLVGVLVTVIVVLIGVVVWQMGWLTGDGKLISVLPSSSEDKKVEASVYSAVFLTNKQVYFGILEDLKSEYPVLKDVYYLKVQEGIQPPTIDEDGKAVKAKLAPQQEVKLIKLGNEMHGPKDEIQLNKDHILYIESLKTDSKIVEAIKKYQEQF